jgi:hypothetical protein
MSVGSECAGFPRIALSLTLGEIAMNFGLLVPQLPHTVDSTNSHHDATPSQCANRQNKSNNQNKIAAFGRAIKSFIC